VNDFVALHDQPRVNMAPGVMNTTARSYANVDATLLGGELSGVATLTDRLFLSGDVSYVRGSQDADPAKQIYSTNLAEMPPLRGRAGLRYDTGRFWGEAEGVFSAAQNRGRHRPRGDPDAGVGNRKPQARSQRRRVHPDGRGGEPLRPPLHPEPLLPARSVPLRGEGPRARTDVLREPRLALLNGSTVRPGTGSRFAAGPVSGGSVVSTVSGRSVPY